MIPMWRPGNGGSVIVHTRCLRLPAYPFTALPRQRSLTTRPNAVTLRARGILRTRIVAPAMPVDDWTGARHIERRDSIRWSAATLVVIVAIVMLSVASVLH